MNIMMKWGLFSAGVMAITLPSWYLGIGFWDGYTYYQYQMQTGQSIIIIGILLQMYETMDQTE